MKFSKSISVVFTVVICAVVETELTHANPDGARLLKPHSLYMQRLREHLSDSKIALPDSWNRKDSIQGRLVASSIETQTSRGRGYSENGFTFEETNMIALEFKIPSQGTEVEDQDTELWIIPDKSQVPKNKVMEIRFLVEANIPPASNRRSYQSHLFWDTNEDCVVFNLTGLSKKIYRVLQKRNLNDSNVSVTVEITKMVESDSKIENNTINILHRDLCSALSQKETNTSFLIVKNYNEMDTPRLTRWYSRRDTSAVSGNFSTESIESSVASCETVPLVVNLTQVYGDFIKAPTVTDIKDCSGRCTLHLDGKYFSKHGEVKERLKLLPGGEMLSSFEPSCKVIQFRPLHVLIDLQDKSDVIIQLSDLVVDKCACQ